MNIKFFKSCYDLAALSTCFKADNNKTFSDSLVEECIEFTDNFFAVARYKCVCSNYESHEFSLTFIRDDKLVETFEFITKVNGKNVGSLANPEIGLEEKLKYIKEYSPRKMTEFENMFKKSKLASYEQDMVIEKCKKKFESIVSNQAKKITKK